MKSSPLAIHTIAMLRQLMADNRYPVGQALPSERQLASELGVSRTVVRIALEVLASEGWIETEPRCRPIVAGKPVRKTPACRPQIGVWLWPYSRDYVGASILRGIRRSLLNFDVRVTTPTVPNCDPIHALAAEESFFARVAKDESTQGVIVWTLGSNRAREHMAAVQRAGKPTVFIDRKPPAGIDSDYVGTDNVAVARRAVSWLIRLGHERIGFVHNSDMVSSVLERKLGYVRALQDAKLPVSTELEFIYCPTRAESDPMVANALAALILQMDNPPTALFCVNDSVAHAVCAALENTGIRVPDRISVLGFDGIDVPLDRGGFITSAVQDFCRMGELAGELLQERILEGSVSAFRHLMLDAPIRADGSTVSPRCAATYGSKVETAQSRRVAAL